MVVVPGLTTALAVPPGGVIRNVMASVPAYQKSRVSGLVSLTGQENWTVAVVPAASTPLACTPAAAAFPADFTIERPLVPSRLSMPRSSSEVPSCGPRLSPWLRLITTGRPSAVPTSNR